MFAFMRASHSIVGLTCFPLARSPDCGLRKRAFVANLPRIAAIHGVDLVRSFRIRGHDAIMFLHRRSRIMLHGFNPRHIFSPDQSNVVKTQLFSALHIRRIFSGWFSLFFKVAFCVANVCRSSHV